MTGENASRATKASWDSCMGGEETCIKGGEGSGAILTSIQKKPLLCFCVCNFSPFLSLCDYDGHVREVEGSYPSFS